MKPIRSSFAFLAVLTSAVASALLWAAAVRAQDARSVQVQDQGAGQPRIESISAQQQGGAEVLRITLNQPLAAPPAGFATSEPPRITFDLDGVLAESRSTVTVQQGNLQTVNTIPAGDRTRVVLHLKQPAAYKTEVQGSALLVTLQPVQAGTVAADATVPAATAAAAQVTESKSAQLASPQVGVDYDVQKLSLNFQDIELRALLQVFADFTNINIVTADTVQGSVTVRMQDVPWDKALDVILKSKGLDKLPQGNVLWIAPRDEIVAREKQEREARAALEALEPLATQAWMLNYAKAQDVARQLSGTGAVMGAVAGTAAPAASAARILSARGSAIAEARTNQLFVTDVADRLEQVRALIARLDIPVRQVLIEARIVEAADTFSKALGVRLGGAGQGNAPGGNTVQLGSYNASTAGATAGTFVNLPALPPTGTPAAFAVSIFGESAARFLNLEISALEADGKGKIISSPRVVTADKVKAVIEQGTELPYQVAAGASGATAIAFRKANLMLEVTPQITPEGRVILDLNVSKDTVGQSTPAGFAIDTKHVQTQVLVDNGGTVVIGGIYLQEETEDVRKVPVLGDMPGLGALFRSSVKRTEKREMLVFITPKALGDQVALLR